VIRKTKDASSCRTILREPLNKRSLKIPQKILPRIPPPFILKKRLISPEAKEAFQSFAERRKPHFLA
jgi:hypothetical protein